MRPILWGTIWFIIGGVGWVGFSILGGITGKLDGFVYFFGTIFFLSLPTAIIAEIIHWIRKKKKEKKEKNKN